MTRLRGGEDVARQLDQIVVIDVEATCWERTPPAGQELEISEIGVCTLSVATRQRLTAEWAARHEPRLAGHLPGRLS